MSGRWKQGAVLSERPLNLQQQSMVCGSLYGMLPAPLTLK